jgi:hypothetical protein
VWFGLCGCELACDGEDHLGEVLARGQQRVVDRVDFREAQDVAVLVQEVVEALGAEKLDVLLVEADLCGQALLELGAGDAAEPAVAEQDVEVELVGGLEFLQPLDLFREDRRRGSAREVGLAVVGVDGSGVLGLPNGEAAPWARGAWEPFGGALESGVPAAVGSSREALDAGPEELAHALHDEALERAVVEVLVRVAHRGRLATDLDATPRLTDMRSSGKRSPDADSETGPCPLRIGATRRSKLQA